MWNLEVIARNILKLNETDALKGVTDNKSIQFQAIRLNRQSQLYERGVGVDGKSLRSLYARRGGFYSPNTEYLKREKGQPINRMTLRDTGKFYATFNAKVVRGELYLTANTIKEGEDLEDRFGKVIGLTEESKDELRKQAKPIIMQYVKSTILR
jgi:hypothetical protein